ncbi:MAG: coproporphyrinogen dehydrogenase HemZ [Clostridia bacterium]|nr:coproporphyrinogen dehydrogenase HemZ [Clostridia bacterium]
MILHIDGNINRYYVQTLCMIFFPGSSFPVGEEPGPDVPELSLKLSPDDCGYTAECSVSYRGRTAFCEKSRKREAEETDERTRKLAVGDAVLSALGDLLEYRPSWGVLTGVRPSKVATEMLSKGVSRTRVKKILTADYGLFAKKAALAVEVANNERKLTADLSPLDCSLYVSIPFCPSRCSYCSFVSYTSKRFLTLIPDYVDRVIVDMKRVFALAREFGLNIRTVYFGGGTPTILEPELIRRLLSTVAEGLDGRVPEEYTYESGRPDTITAEKLAVLREFGVDRISVNPQTLSDEVMAGIGRHHTVDDFYRAFSLAREAGFGTINTDPIAGLPGDDFRKFSASVDGILALRPENVTVHTFCVKRSAELKARDDIYSMRGGDAGKCVDYSQIKMRQAGYIPYYMYRQKNTVGNFENVGFSLPGHEGRYNIYMMEELHTILAVGAGAVSKFVRLPEKEGQTAVIRRIFNSKYPYEYLDRGNCDDMIEQMRGLYSDYQR